MTNGERFNTYKVGDKVRVSHQNPTWSLVKNLERQGLDKSSILTIQSVSEYPWIRFYEIGDGYHFANFSKVQTLPEDLFTL